MRHPSYIVIDIETTGLSANIDQIIEISAVKVSNGLICEVFDRLIKIDDPISPFITELTGITTKLIEEKGTPLKSVLRDLVFFVGDYPIVGHNIRFDMGFIAYNLALHLGVNISNTLIDTLTLSRRYYNCVNYKLETLALKFNKQYYPSHRALNDVMATYELYEGLLKIEKD
jgi:DNA polymerase III epsilon subunit family exonuclease